MEQTETVTVTLPEMGESVTEGSVVELRKRVGDYVQEGDTLLDVTTDKVDVEIPAPASGAIVSILVSPGDAVTVGAKLMEFDANATPGAAVAAPKGAAPAAPAKSAPPAPAQRSDTVVADQPARRMAKRLDVDLALVRGSGPNGLILRGDVLDQAQQAKRRGPATSAGASWLPLPAVPANAKVTPLKGPVGTLATYMEQSLTIPTATSFRTLLVDVLDARRKELNGAIKAAGRNEKVSFTHVIAYALVRAAHEIPAITYSFRRDDGGAPMRVEPGVHLGLAVDAERKDGSRFLVVPVIKNADSLDFAAFRLKYEELVAKSRDNKLTADDLQGASFTLTNPGGIGTVASVPRLMAGQGAIVAAGAIGYPPGFAAANEQSLKLLGVSRVMQMTSTYDHRVIQGAQSGEYLRRVDELLQGKNGFYESVFASLGLQAAAVPQVTIATGAAPSAGAPAAAPSDEMLRAVAAGMAIVSAYRRFGHLAANLDPLGAEPVGDSSLEPQTYGLTPALQSAIPASVLRVKLPGNTLAEVLPHLKETYASTIAYEIEHISNATQRVWLRDYVETGKNRIKFSPERQIEFLQRLTRVEAFDRYVRKTFLGQKSFSGEGLDVMVPMLQEMLDMLADDGVDNAVIGMAHRGRLNVIAHVVDMPYEEVMTEFEAGQYKGQLGDDDVMGDVKYHHGAKGDFVTSKGKHISVTLAHNPSHLEAVDPVVEGSARALQTDHGHGVPSFERKRAVPVLIHGDAAFIGQGIVSEVFNLQSLPGYDTGGTVHLIANNQIGFTTDSFDARSTRYASDLAKGFDVPIVHVNADDVDACIAAVHLAIDYRRAFSRDVLIDLIGYRRFGHNEQDEPAYTQPHMAEKIKSHPTVRELFANKLINQGLLTSEQSQAMTDAATERLQEARKAVKGALAAHMSGRKVAGSNTFDGTVLAPVARAQLVTWSDAIAAVPEDFGPNRKLLTQFERRKATIADKGIVDWGTAEALSFASLLTSGTPIRLTGQDSERGTFSHRHAVLHDPSSGKTWIPLQHLSSGQASFEIHNSPLSEYACMGFEYGYSAEEPNALVLWEAQYGDFFNGAQVIVDQFIAAGQAKWGQTSRLTLLLPHGYEGGGPEHSSARLERFLQLVAEGNLRVAYPSTAANYYHLLRMQARSPIAVPLVVMTPKSLLRAETASGSLDDMAGGTFLPVIDDPRQVDRNGIERLILCSGKIYHDLVAHDGASKLKKTAIARIELLAPLPATEINRVIGNYPNLKKIVWVQEEPKNMGARAFVRRRLLESKRDGFDIEYIGRGYRASPSEGYAGQHAVEQERILGLALSE
ncbi:MAG TPA: multifunctional oxoglutarate decarboxylase/oxoglutarate dehydrogenase thiamine pyrophosphate-binding subunit/dihydrolipoyllysine-residue succinyltransferase subunit [Candidatus Baltobacteraceae bacterium]|nr:multifunctional oxoglutarate decarboxylase/oxoglutarate dehydrogenase thiamine pyrophosphate-binding subunit/dihydrolipoyllysine-residue succinyltransferase subunit [Candidatus Baltobacteraceae bacterium]